MTKPRYSRLDYFPGCAVEGAINLIDGKWKCVILWHLLTDGTLRFNELRKRIPAVSQRVLTTQLRELETDGMVHREVYAQVPPKVEYSLTDMGEGLAPILNALRDWGAAHMDIYSNVQKSEEADKAAS